MAGLEFFENAQKKSLSYSILNLCTLLTHFLFLFPLGMMDSATAAMISEGRNLADRLNAHFATTTSNSPVLPRLQSNNGSFYNPFFREVFEKKNEIEQV